MYAISFCYYCNELTLTTPAQFYKYGYDTATIMLCYECCQINKERFGPYSLRAIEHNKIFRISHTPDSPFNFVFK